MQKQELFEKCKIILETKVGSHLYGSNTEDSDVDFCGIFIPPKEYYLGFHSIKEIDLSVIDKLDTGKNSKDAVDRKLYELRHFCQLALQGNPNIIEVLFSNEFALRISSVSFVMSLISPSFLIVTFVKASKT